ncbi:MAG: FAD-dependent oxidoreductase [Candidatus Caccosoma sp.]|nr:FAD-dependent oxidoreductase [Candidatus Caccosoma sp.]
MKKYNVIVIGGGLSGVCAAISAARENKSVLLIEEGYHLGGTATKCLINPFMKFHLHNGKSISTCTRVNQGLFSEIIYELSKLHGIDFKDMDNIVFNNEYLKVILENMCLKYNVEILYGAKVTSVELNKNLISSIEIFNQQGFSKVEANYFIDCSGDANIAAYANVPFRVGREKDNFTQPLTLCFDIANVDMAEFKKERPLITPKYVEFKEKGLIHNPRENVLMFPCSIPNAIHFNTTRITNLSSLNATDFSKAQIEGRRQMMEMFKFLKENFKSFKDSQIMNSASIVGVRESRMIDGLYTLKEEDIKEYRKFEDGIACSCYNIDIHSPDGEGTHIFYLDPNNYYSIPYRCLITKQYDNLIVAGRCISSTHEAQSSLRIMPVVANIGEAAGIAAALACNKMISVKDIDVSLLQKVIQDNGGKCF